MNFQVTIGFNDEALSAIKDLTAAIRSVGSATPVQAASASAVAAAAEKPSAEKSSAEKPAAESKAADKAAGPIYWANNETGHFGKVDTEAEYKVKKKAEPAIIKITDTIYERKLAELKAKNEARAAADAKPAAEAKEVPTVEELIEVFSAYLPKDLSKEERAERHGFVKPLLQRFGANLARELLPEHRALAINLVQRKMAGEDIDPTSSDFAEVAAEAEAEDSVI